jgi:hypothetical protein
MRNNRAISVVSGLAILGSATALVLTVTGGPGPRLEPGPFREAGRVLAQQALSQLKPGGLVMVITRDTAAFQNPASDVLLKSFRNELSGNGVKIDSIQTIEVDPLRPVSVPAGDFFHWINKAAKGSVLVSFMGPPVLNETQISQLGEIKPAIIALCSGPVRDQVELRTLFSQGLLRTAVVSRRPVLASSAKAGTDHDAFDREFVAVTANNVTALPISANP